MDIRLAGFNVEKDILTELDPQGRIVGPEVFSAAYARISRSSKSIDTLRREARNDIHKARKSNEKIIFGMGHHSVAEHAVFNFDLMGISRLALEAVEQFRLVSYTEKSQRYVTLSEDWVMPKEVEEAGLEKPFSELVKTMHRFYRSSSEKLFAELCAQNPQRQKKGERSDMECRAKEDARYVLPLATSGQVGLTINARNLEHLMRRFHLSHLKEVRLIGNKLFQLVENLAPSLILFPHPSRFETQFSEQFSPSQEETQGPESLDDPFSLNLFEIPSQGDDTVLALLLSSQENLPLGKVLERVGRMAFCDKKREFVQLFENMEFFDAPPRHFEFISLSFEAVVSASCFAQLKRHRMASLLAGPYSPNLGHTVPQQIQDAGLSADFEQIVSAVNGFFAAHGPLLKHAAQYVLTNSHRRRVSMRFNFRDLYHFIRLRSDAHSQWEIRDLASQIEQKIRKELPLTTLMLCGKDRFAVRKEDLLRE